MCLCGKFDKKSRCPSQEWRGMKATIGKGERFQRWYKPW